MTTPEEAIERYNNVLKLVKQGYTKTEAYKEMNVDRNAIVNQAPIAELKKVNPDTYDTLRNAFTGYNSKLSDFAHLCYT